MPYMRHIINLDRRFKQLLLVILDFILIPFCFLISYSLHYDFLNFFTELKDNLWLLFVPGYNHTCFHKNGLYRSVLKYMGYYVVIATLRSVTLACAVFILIALIVKSHKIISIILIFWLVSTFVIIGSRYILKAFLYYSRSNRKHVAIYGAGKIGAQLINYLKVSSEYLPIALFDDDKSKWGSSSYSITVVSQIRCSI